MSSAGESAGPVPGAFSQLMDKSLQNEALVSAWCPTMDLLALATTDGQVAVHRLIWEPVSLQQLWAAAPDGTTTSMCWRPDGKAVAVGLENGAVVHMHVEDGKIMHRANHHDSPVVAMSWVEPDVMPCVADRAREQFPPPPEPLPDPAKVAAEPYSNIGDQQTPRWPPPQGNGASLTVTVDSGGRIHICSFGTFLLGSLDLFALVGGGCTKESTEVLGASQSQDLQQLAVLVEHKGSDGDGNSVHLAVLDTSVLTTRGAELYQLALQATEILRLLEGAKETLQEARAKWADAMKQSKAKWAQLQHLLQGHASALTPKQELLNLLACGFPSAALRQFLSSSLGEAGLKRLAKVVDSAVSAVHELLLDHLSPALELAAFRLGELRGIASCDQWIQPLELEVERLRSAELQCLGLFMQTKQLMMEVTTCGTHYRMFYLWLLRSILLLNFDKLPQDTSWPVNSVEVVEFLQKYFQTDAVACQLASDGTASCRESTSGAAYISELQTIVLGKESLLRPIGGGLCTLVDECKRLWASIPASLASSLQLVSWTCIARASHAVGCIRSGNSGSTSEVQVFVAVNDAESPGVRCSVTTTSAGPESATGESLWELMGICMPRQPAAKAVEASQISFHAPAGKVVLDAQFYKDGKVAMVLASEDDGAGAPTLAVLDCSKFDETQQRTSLSAPPLTSGDVGTLPEEAVLLRVLPSACQAKPLAVSGPRGVACILTDQQRALIFDLEDNENEDEDEEDDDDDTDEEA